MAAICLGLNVLNWLAPLAAHYIKLSSNISNLISSLNIIKKYLTYLDGLVQERRNSIANALELCLSCTNPSI